MPHDLHNRIQPRRAIAPVDVGDNTAQVGQIIDRQGYEALEYVVVIGGIADANATFAILLEHGDDEGLSDAAAVADADLLGTEALAGFQFDSDNETRKIGYVGGKRYTRLTITPSGNASSALISAVAILGCPHVAPVANPPD